MKELEKQRIEKIKILNQDQTKAYIDVLIDDICELYDFSSVTNPDERLNEIYDRYSKLKEVGDLTIDKFNRIKEYIRQSLDNELLFVYAVNGIKDTVEYANLTNHLILILIKNIMNDYVNVLFYLTLFHGIFNKLKLIQISADADDVNLFKDVSIAEFQKIFPYIVDHLKYNIEKIDDLFYSDDELIDGIDYLKKSLSEISASDDESNMKFKKHGIIKVYSDLLDAYIHQMDLKKLYDKSMADIVDLLESDNVFLNYSKSNYERLNVNVDFDEFMKTEPKFDLKNFELKQP